MVECFKGALPWSPNDISRIKLAAIKRASASSLFKGMPQSFAQIHDSVSILKWGEKETENDHCSQVAFRYADDPPYDTYTGLLRQTILSEKVNVMEPFDFERGGCQFDQVFAQICAKRAQKRRRRVGKQDAERRSRDELTMRHVSFRHNDKEAWTDAWIWGFDVLQCNKLDKPCH